jgi:hypothetical protein
VGQLLDQAELQVLEALAPDCAAEPQDRRLTDAQVGLATDRTLARTNSWGDFRISLAIFRSDRVIDSIIASRRGRMSPPSSAFPG